MPPMIAPPSEPANPFGFVSGPPAPDALDHARGLGIAAGWPKQITDEALSAQLQAMGPDELAAFKKGFTQSMTMAMGEFRKDGTVNGVVYSGDKVRRRILTALGPKDGARFEASLHLDNLEHAAGQKLAPQERQHLVGIAISAPDKLSKLHGHVAGKFAKAA
jgi:hypothetical protein